MRPEGPTEAEANALVAARKYIKEIPRASNSARESKMTATVYALSTRQAIGVALVATQKKSPAGIPTPIPSAALELAGRFRIRGINYSLWHDCPSGPIVYGWHEHVWTNQYEDHVVIQAKPTPSDKAMSGLFRWGLKKWNITVGEPSETHRGKQKNKRRT